MSTATKSERRRTSEASKRRRKRRRERGYDDSPLASFIRDLDSVTTDDLDWDGTTLLDRDGNVLVKFSDEWPELPERYRDSLSGDWRAEAIARYEWGVYVLQTRLANVDVPPCNCGMPCGNPGNPYWTAK